MTSQTLIKYHLAGREHAIILILLMGNLKCEATNPKLTGNKINTRTHRCFAYYPKSLPSQNTVAQSTIIAAKSLLLPIIFHTYMTK